MAQSLSKILLHLVFSTKNRESLIDPQIRPALHAYLAGGVRALGSEAYRVGGVAFGIECENVTPFQGLRILDSP